MSAFALDDGVVRHTYPTCARGLDGLWGMCQWLEATRGHSEARLPTPLSTDSVATTSTTPTDLCRRRRHRSRRPTTGSQVDARSTA